MVEFEYVKDIVVQNKFAILGILIGGVSIVGSAFYVSMNKCPDICTEECKTEALAPSEQDSNIKTSSVIKVDIKGAVKKPGVYQLDDGSCVLDALTMAGGLNSKGTTTNINLSRKLKDEMVVYIFTKEELKKRESKNEIVCEVPKCECEIVDTSVCLPEVNPSQSSTEKDNNKNDDNSNKDASQKVSLNKGSLKDFMTLDGIGESKAEAIIKYREEHGEFQKIEDIMNVSGIGEKAYEKIKDRLTL